MKIDYSFHTVDSRILTIHSARTSTSQSDTYIILIVMPYREESHSPPRRHLERSLSPERNQDASTSAGPSKKGRVGPNDIQRRHVCNLVSFPSWSDL